MIDKQKIVTVTRILEAPIEKVWDAWTNPESMKLWLSPEGMTTPEVSVDLAVGGSYRVVMEKSRPPESSQSVRMSVGGEYLEIDRPAKLVFTWLWEGSPADTHTSTVTVLLKQLGEMKTELTIIHSGLADEEMQKEHELGWRLTVGKLNEFLGGGDKR